jgi:hypothetical protein
MQTRSELATGPSTPNSPRVQPRLLPRSTSQSYHQTRNLDRNHSHTHKRDSQFQPYLVVGAENSICEMRKSRKKENNLKCRYTSTRTALFCDPAAFFCPLLTITCVPLIVAQV